MKHLITSFTCPNGAEHFYYIAPNHRKRLFQEFPLTSIGIVHTVKIRGWLYLRTVFLPQTYKFRINIITKNDEWQNKIKEGCYCVRMELYFHYLKCIIFSSVDSLYFTSKQYTSLLKGQVYLLFQESHVNNL